MSQNNKNYLSRSKVVIPIDMNLDNLDDQALPKKSIIKRLIRPFKTKYFKRISLALSCLVIMLSIVIGESYFKLHQIFQGGVANAASLTPNVNPNLLNGEGSGRINVLLLGKSDDKSQDLDATDSIILASIDPITDKAVLIDIPNNLWVNVPNMGLMKLSDVYAKAEYLAEGNNQPNSSDHQVIKDGFTAVDQMVDQILGINVDYNAMINYKGFTNAVDQMGGINVNVPTAITDPTVAWQNNNNPVVATSGQQILSGTQALLYVRSIETSSQTSRDLRSMSVLLDLVYEIEHSSGVSGSISVASLLNNIGNNVYTDLSISQASKLYNIIKQISLNNVGTDDLSSTKVNNSALIYPSQAVGQAVDVPGAGLFDYSAIKSYISSILPDPYLQKENAKIELLNATMEPGLAAKEQVFLESYGYNVVNVGNTPGLQNNSQIIQVNPSDVYTNHYLENRLNISSTTKIPFGINPKGYDFIVTIGNDMSTTIENQTN